MEIIAIPAIVWIITTGVYSIFELFARKKERMALIDKLGEKIGPELLEGRLKLNSLGRNSFGVLKWGALLASLGLGLLVGFLISNHYFPSDLRESWRFNEMRGMIYGASMLIFGGLALLIVFLVEYRLSKK
jgi:hypothetical protein